jgi:hypothetical protein
MPTSFGVSIFEARDETRVIAVEVPSLWLGLIA